MRERLVEADRPPPNERCEPCGGRGRRIVWARDGMSGRVGPCPDCDGTGIAAVRATKITFLKDFISTSFLTDRCFYCRRVWSPGATQSDSLPSTVTARKVLKAALPPARQVRQSSGAAA